MTPEMESELRAELALVAQRTCRMLAQRLLLANDSSRAAICTELQRDFGCMNETERRPLLWHADATIAVLKDLGLLE